MKVQYYEEVFEVTETCNNGKERRIRKSVMCQPFEVRDDGTRHHRLESTRIEKATRALKQEHYYNIVYIETRIKHILFA